MKVLTLNRFVDFDGTHVPAGVPQVWPDGFADAFRLQMPQVVQAFKPLNGEYRHYRGQALDGKRLLLWRTGGFGDLLFLTPLLRELKHRHPDCHLTVACRPRYHGVFRRNPDVDQLLGLPVPLPILDAHDFHLHFEGTIEKSTDPDLHAVDLFATHAGVKLTDHRLVFSLADEQRERGRQSLRELNPEGKPAVAVQVRASSPVRTYPWPSLEKVIRSIVAEGKVVVLLGGMADSPGLQFDGVFDLCGVFREMTDSVAMMAACDCLIAPDSSLTHFAGALGVPTVALYGPFPGKVRTAHYQHCVTLEPDFPCLPCFTHGHLPCPEARKRDQAHSPCFSGIAPERVREAVNHLLNQPRRP